MLLLPCKDCLIIPICYNDKQKIIKCELFKEFVDDNIFDQATNMVKTDSGKLGFHIYITDHPTNDNVVLGIKVLVYPDNLSIQNVIEFKKV